MRIPLIFFAVFSLAGICSGQSSLPGCEPRPEVRQVLQEKLRSEDLGRLKYVDRVAREHAVLDDLIAKYPRELEPYRRLINFVHYDTDDYPALQARYREQAKQHPDDPLALYLAGAVLFHTDTPESIRLVESAKAKARDFAWPNLQLAEIYSSGKLVDKKKAAEYLAEFFSACPGSTDRKAHWLLAMVGDSTLQASVAADLRKRLATETNLDELKQYETLWGLEFRTRPPQEHAALREQVAADLKRVEPLDPKPDGEWMGFVRKGYKQSGASEAELTALDDKILKEFPTSRAAYDVAFQRFKKAHKEPEDQKDAKAWAAYNLIYRDALKGWIRDYTDVTYLSRSSWFYEINNDDTISEKEGIAALDHYLKSSLDYDQTDSSAYLNGAEFLIEHKWEPKRALDLLHKAQPLVAKEIEQQAQDDNRAADKQEDAEKYVIYEQQNLAGLMLRAAKLAGKPAEAQALRAPIEGPTPKAKTRVSDYWLNRARLAVLENRKADGLTYYQLALQTRVTPPSPWHGKLEDNLTDEARALWKDIGGTEVAWAVWSQPPAAKPAELAEGRWEKPKKPIPQFELADLSGKTWKLKTLEGKTVLINLWATWCGPCNAELPHFQKLYEKVKDRPDFQVLTFNLDEDLGLVEPFMKEKGYTFPVLPAYSLVVNLLDGYAIPQNWVVDPVGTWRWTQIGFGGEPDWIDSMIQRLESVKKTESGL
ncbi:MAG TPA: TlpA disulfide reductase family protein [Bryobacteraceae bacterium]|nr:TlpA disulfide reductase family protein [Bryobacteraceae bacterium]